MLDVLLWLTLYQVVLAILGRFTGSDLAWLRIQGLIHLVGRIKVVLGALVVSILLFLAFVSLALHDLRLLGLALLFAVDAALLAVICPCDLMGPPPSRRPPKPVKEKKVRAVKRPPIPIRRRQPQPA